MLFFYIRQLNYCTGDPPVTGLFSWSSAPAKRLKTTDLDLSCLARLAWKISCNLQVLLLAGSLKRTLLMCSGFLLNVKLN